MSSYFGLRAWRLWCFLFTHKWQDEFAIIASHFWPDELLMKLLPSLLLSLALLLAFPGIATDIPTEANAPARLSLFHATLFGLPLFLALNLYIFRVIFSKDYDETHWHKSAKIARSNLSVLNAIVFAVGCSVWFLSDIALFERIVLSVFGLVAAFFLACHLNISSKTSDKAYYILIRALLVIIFLITFFVMIYAENTRRKVPVTSQENAVFDYIERSPKATFN